MSAKPLLQLVVPLLIGALAQPAFAEREVMLVLDNSGSMRRNDPQRLAHEAVAQFVLSQSPTTRVGLVLFADAATVAVPLTAASAISEPLPAALERLDYRGLRTRTAEAVERALYELRAHSRPGAERALVLVTDGLVDTGDAARDAEHNLWLRQDLATQAARDGVRIFGVAFTEGADYRLLQALAVATQAEYFRVLSADQIGRALQRIETVLATPPAPEKPAVVASVPVPASPAPAEVEANRGAWMLAAAGLVLLALLLWRFRAQIGLWSRAHGGPSLGVDEGPRASLVDIYSGSGARNYILGARPVALGRLMGSDPKRDYVVVPDKTVGRWHASIERRGATFWLRDERSVNGTWLNDERIEGERPLKHEDKIRLHQHEFRFMLPELLDSEATLIVPAKRLKA